MRTARLTAASRQILVTPRDVELLQFINRFGFCEMRQLEQRFALKKPRNYQIIKRLIDAGLVKHERIFYGKPGIYRLTVKGAAYTDLPCLQRVPLANYTHDLLLVDLFLVLSQQYREAQWVSERELKKEKYQAGVGVSGHLPDALLLFPDGQQVAVELELTLKSRARIEALFKHYGARFDLTAVWYYCPQTLLPSLQALARQRPYLHLYALEAILPSAHEAKAPCAS